MSPKQRVAVATATGRVNIFDGSIRSGKTFAWLLIMPYVVVNAGREGAIVVCGKNRDSIYRNVFEPLLTLAVFGVFAPHIRYRQGAPTATIFGRTVHVMGANAAKSEARLRGITVLYVFVDEITVLDMAFVKQLFGRMSLAKSQMFATTNPDTPPLVEGRLPRPAAPPAPLELPPLRPRRQPVSDRGIQGVDPRRIHRPVVPRGSAS